MAAKKARKKTRSKKTVEAASRGLSPAQSAGPAPPAATARLADAVEADGGRVVGSYRDPLGGKWQLAVVLPLERVAATPFQRDLSEAHVQRLARVLDKLDRFLDPILVVRRDDGTYWTPNGHHRTAAMRALGARSIAALLVPEAEMAYQILALNTEKAHNLRERALEVIRMARDLAAVDPAPERSYRDVFEEPLLLTLGACYELEGRFPGSVYRPVLSRVEAFLASALPSALEVREERAAKLIEIDAAVSSAVAALKQRGFDSPYLKNYVVARINPVRARKDETPEFDAVADKMLASARAFDPSSVKAEQVARTAGPPPE